MLKVTDSLKKDLLVFLTMCGVVLLSNWNLYLIDTPIWDDWTIFKQSFSATIVQFSENGGWMSGFGYIHYFLNRSDNPIVVYHFLQIVFVVLSGLILYYLILCIWKSRISAALIALIYVSMPFNFAKFTMICLPYSVFNAFFLLGIFTLNKFFENKKTINLIVGVISICYASLHEALGFLFCLYAIYLFVSGIVVKKNKNWVFLLLITLPIITLTVKKLAAPVTGVYAKNGYKNITIDGFSHFVDLVFTNLLAPIRIGKLLFDYTRIHFSWFFLGLGVLLLTVVAFRFLKKGINFKLILLYVVVCYVMLCACFTPYVLTGKLTVSLFVDSRSQIGFAIIFPIVLIFFMDQFVKKKGVVIFGSFIILVGILLTNALYMDVQKYKILDFNESYNSSLLKNEENNQSMVFVYEERSNKCPGLLKSFQRHRFYEFSNKRRVDSLKVNVLVCSVNDFCKLKNTYTFDLFSGKEMYGLADFDGSNYLLLGTHVACK